MQLGRLNIQLARTKRPKLDSEVGSSSSINNQPSLFAGEVIPVEKIKAKDYLLMRDQDGTAEAMFNLIVLPVLATTWNIEPEDESPEAKKQAEFVQEALELPPHKGGMTTPFDLVLENMLEAVLLGFRAFEKVLTLNQRGQIVYRKIAPRDNRTITIREDEHGGFNGFRQQIYINGKYIDTVIDRQYAFLYTFGKAKNPLYGRSAFRAAYYHYDKKHRAYYATHQALQKYADPSRVVEVHPDLKGKVGQPVLDDATEAMDKLANNSSVALPPGLTAKTLSAAGRIDPLPYIEHHDVSMTRSILANFIMLGNGKSGSWALSRDQSDFFVLSERAILSSIENHINSYLLPDLIDYNFAVKKYPKLVFAEMTESTRELLRDVFIKIVEKTDEGKLPAGFLEGVVEKMAAQLKIDLDKKQQQQSHGKAGRHFLADSRWHRQLTPAEGKVNFAAIQKKYDTLQEDALKAARPVWERIEADVTAELGRILDAEDYAALDSLKIPHGDEYRKIITDQLVDAYNFAKKGAADEMDRKIPATSERSREVIRQEAKAVVDKQFNDLLFAIREEVNSARRKNQLSKVQLDAKGVIAAIAGAISAFFDSRVSAGFDVLIAGAITVARDDVFTEYLDDISRFQWSAILDGKTCPICLDLDGRVVSVRDYRSTPWKPPVHFSCRCIWVEILKDEVDPPEIDGLPDAPGGVESPLL